MRTLIFTLSLLSTLVGFAQKTQFKYAFENTAKFGIVNALKNDEKIIINTLKNLEIISDVSAIESPGFYEVQWVESNVFNCDKIVAALSAIDVQVDFRSIYVFDKQMLMNRPDKIAEGKQPSENTWNAITFDTNVVIKGDMPSGTIVPVTFIAGQRHSITLDIDEKNGYPNYGKLWIDFNGDGKFSMKEAVATWNGDKTIEFIVPAQTCNGQMTMKLIQAEGDMVLFDRDYFISNTQELRVTIQNGDCDTDFFKAPDGNQDCDDAQPLCEEDYEQTTSPPGEGFNNVELTDLSTSCFSENGTSNSYEQNSVWYTFTTPNNGNLSFTITPNDLNDDYDWVVFDITGFSCADIATNSNLEVSCNFSGISGLTGPNGQGSTNSEGGGGNPFNAAIPVQAGNSYVILVNNWSLSSNGYSIDYGQSTADVYATDLNTVDQEICKGDSALLKALYSGATFGTATYTWSPDSLVLSPTTKNTLTTPLTEDTIVFYVSLNLGQCDFTDSLIVYTYASLSDFDIEYNPVLSPVEVEFFNNSAENTVNYSWDFGNEEVSEKENPQSQFYVQPGEYTVSLMTENELGCLDTSYQTINVPKFDIPNVITPNGDGINERLVITGLKENTNLVVYNRWGKKVEEVFGFKNNWNGGDLSDGVYYYVVTQQDGAAIESFTGWLQIMR